MNPKLAALLLMVVLGSSVWLLNHFDNQRGMNDPKTIRMNEKYSLFKFIIQLVKKLWEKQ